jgi:hypothetical protein
MALDAKFVLKAQDELREDDLRKKQALEQFREWLQKQSHIKNCRTGNFVSYYCASVIIMSDNEKMIKVQVGKSKCDVTAQKKLHS